MMFSIKLQTVIHFLQQEKQEQITMRLNHNFKTGKTLRRSVDVNQVQDSEKTFDMFSIFARHLHSLTQLERTEILQTLTNISIYNTYCARANFLWWFLYEFSKKAEMAKDEGIDLSVILLNQAPSVLNTPSVLMISPRCTHGIPLVY